MTPSDSPPNILDHSAISGSYLFPQQRYIDDPFLVEVGDVELRCFRKIIDPDRHTIVHFHGNGEAAHDYLAMADALTAFGLNSLFVEYREYGGSTGKAQLAAMLGDGEAVMNAAGLSADKVIAFGRSVGSLYAIELAHRQPKIAGLILESGIARPAERFLMHADLAAAQLHPEDILREADRLFNHQDKLSGYHGPLLVLHTENDGLVDISHAEQNFQWAASATEAKTFVRFAMGDHNSILAVNQAEYFKAVREFIETQVAGQ
jgi:pimeloyl-ACP methyl ester carboxylesterase